MEFNVELYDFLKENEVHIWKERDELKFGVVVNSYETCDFMETLNKTDFDDDGVKCVMKDDYLFVELQEIFKNNGYRIKDYKKVFDENKLFYLEELISKFDE